ncbi:hypothetical protein M885DRAFT_287906 [Pelagophyceae sp. CCMP2097]|nr:hypothetical protein M885DRAFT_287906 [Pelagophyceae sp. CCMP2097]
MTSARWDREKLFSASMASRRPVRPGPPYGTQGDDPWTLRAVAAYRRAQSIPRSPLATCWPGRTSSKRGARVGARLRVCALHVRDLPIPPPAWHALRPRRTHSRRSRRARRAARRARRRRVRANWGRGRASPRQRRWSSTFTSRRSASCWAIRPRAARRMRPPTAQHRHFNDQEPTCTALDRLGGRLQGRLRAVEGAHRGPEEGRLRPRRTMGATRDRQRARQGP